jgi:hypothetical protein
LIIIYFLKIEVDDKLSTLKKEKKINTRLKRAGAGNQSSAPKFFFLMPRTY